MDRYYKLLPSLSTYLVRWRHERTTGWMLCKELPNRTVKFFRIYVRDEMLPSSTSNVGRLMDIAAPDNVSLHMERELRSGHEKDRDAKAHRPGKEERIEGGQEH